ncbi:DUF190 domain-containing protein [Phytoactinopolyspora mesophila]|uniref:DUF190 domain-containing protein n=1 Tax=Phytoactinopolyspora mesophila TaxID=2650750 RepID=A0A7K3M463_9ACTN|nr:DUF190 domain-containing protein [Phytoactinopolyspora mesophila]NDL57218.1 DUF190 domain-containing protein [Phytoactinopolyspora mesophila]
MDLTGPARRLSIVMGETDTWHGKPLYSEIVRRAHARGLAGASVFRGIEGYGASNHIHTTRIFSLSEDLPVQVVIVDNAAKIEAFIDEIEPIVVGGLITLTDVEVVRYAGRSDAAGSEADQGPDVGGDRDAGGGPRPGSDGAGEPR